MRAQERNPLLGALAGAVGGIAGSLAMVAFNHLMGGGGSRQGDSHPHRRTRAQPNDIDGTISDEPGSMQAAQALAAPLVRRPLDEQEKERAGVLVHHLFGAAVGAMYGAAAETRIATTAGAGVPFGTAVWLAADEIGLPLAGFAAPPSHYPLERHAAALGSHIVFGLTVECVRRLLRGQPASP
jgi:hypothetical protein